MMHPTDAHVTRRRFLSGLAVLGFTPVASRLDGFGLLDALAQGDRPRQFLGDDFERAHEVLFDPDALFARGVPRDAGPPHDVLIVGGGMSGLVAAWLLRDRNVVLLEREASMGGVSKSATWRGIEYALGAAYVIDPDPDAEDPRERRTFALLEELGLRQRGEDLSSDRSRQRRLSGEGNHCLFGNTRVFAERDVYTARNDAFFRHVLDHDRFPGVPAEDRDLVEALDRVSFSAFLKNTALQRRVYGRTVGTVGPRAWEAIEYYFWGAFGTTPAETSAYHGLNFFAAEYGSVLAYPGGNGFITRRIADRLRPLLGDRLRSNAWVVRIEPEPETGRTRVTALEGNDLVRYSARQVIYSAPLFLAPRLVPSLPGGQKEAIGSLQYRAYLVANVFLGRSIDRVFAHPAFRNGFELTRLHGVDPTRVGAEALSTQKVFSDVVVGDFAAGRQAEAGVLTVYRPYPYAAGRQQLMEGSYESLEAEVTKAVLEGFGRHGLQAKDILGVQLSRWGHPMVVPRPGQMADGVLGRAAQRQAGLLFAHTDMQGAPAFENALASAFDAADAIGGARG